MMKKMSFAAILMAMLCAACSSKPDPEQLAGEMIAKARTDLQNKQYDAARDSIKSMRVKYPTAIAARRDGILLLDSVELFQTREELEPLGPELDAERVVLKGMMEKPHYKKNPDYFAQNRKVFAMEQRYDSVAAKVKFFEKKIEIDKSK